MRKFLATLVLVAAIVCAWMYGTNSRSHSVSFYSMDTPMTLTAYGGKAENALSAARKRIKQIENEISVTDDESDIAKLNSGTALVPQEDTAQLINTALELSAQTAGAFDPTIYPVLRAWGFTTGAYKVPEKGELDELKKLTGIEKVHLDGGKFTLESGTMIDLGGIGKGYAAQKATETLKEQGVKSAILNLGGNVQTLGTPPHRKFWRVGIRAPKDESLLGVLSIGECAIVTSGGYERYFIAPNGEVFWHIIDPDTAHPARSGVTSSTVVGHDGTLCDALSTAFFVMGAQKSANFWKAHSEFGFILLEGETIWVTEDLEKNFVPDKAFSSINVVRR